MKVNPIIYGAISPPDAQHQIEEGYKGIAQKTLNLSEIKKMRIPVPDLGRQKEFVSFVAQIDKSKSAIQKPLIRQAPGRQHDKAIFAILRKMIEIHFLPVMG